MKTKTGKAVSNREAWLRLDRQISRHRLEWHVLGRDDEVEEMEGVKRDARRRLQQ